MSKSYDYGYNIKSVRLCDESKEIADSINFSRWCREELVNWNRRMAEAHTQPVGMGFHRLCNPFHKSGVCEQCWPVGIPERDAWLQYIKASREGLEPEPPEVVVEEPRTSPYQGEKAGFFSQKARAKKTNQNTSEKYFAALGWLVALIAILL